LGRHRIYFGVAIDVLTGKAISREPSFVQMDHTFSQIERFIGSDQSDTIRGGLTGDYIDGDAGNDGIQGGLGNDTIYGGGGDDVIDGDEFDDRIYGGDGNDTLRGGTGNDMLTGDAGHDSFDGGAPTPPDEEKDIATDWAMEPQDGSCTDTLQCP
jgi:Ca2+-binding RTX toxin-like protein